MLLFNVICGDIAFQADEEIISGAIPWTREISDAFRERVGNCLKKSALERPSLMQIANNVWINETVTPNAQSDERVDCKSLS
jgi:hypothetical protein